MHQMFHPCRPYQDGVVDMIAKIGDRLQIPNNGYGKPVLEFNRKTKDYGPALQWFEVTGIDDNGNLALRPIWLNGKS